MAFAWRSRYGKGKVSKACKGSQMILRSREARPCRAGLLWALLASGCAPLQFTISRCIDDARRLTNCECQGRGIRLGEGTAGGAHPGEKPVMIPPMVPRGRWFVVSIPLDHRTDDASARGRAHCGGDRIDAEVVFRRHVGKGDDARAEYLAYLPPPGPREANSRACTFYMELSVEADLRQAKPREVHLVHRMRQASANGRWYWRAPTPTDEFQESQLEPPPAPVNPPECR